MHSNKTNALNLILLFHIYDDTMRKKCPYSELFWSAFSYNRTEYGKIRSISPYSVRIRENADQNNSEYGHFPRSDIYLSNELYGARCFSRAIVIEINKKRSYVVFYIGANSDFTSDIFVKHLMLT